MLDGNEVRELPESLCALTSLRRISACQNRHVSRACTGLRACILVVGLSVRQNRHSDCVMLPSADGAWTLA